MHVDIIYRFDHKDKMCVAITMHMMEAFRIPTRGLHEMRLNSLLQLLIYNNYINLMGVGAY